MAHIDNVINFLNTQSYPRFHFISICVFYRWRPYPELPYNHTRPHPIRTLYIDIYIYISIYLSMPVFNQLKLLDSQIVEQCPAFFFIRLSIIYA